MSIFAVKSNVSGNRKVRSFGPLRMSAAIGVSVALAFAGLTALAGPAAAEAGDVDTGSTTYVTAADIAVRPSTDPAPDGWYDDGANSATGSGTFGVVSSATAGSGALSMTTTDSESSVRIIDNFDPDNYVTSTAAEITAGTDSISTLLHDGLGFTASWNIGASSAGDIDFQLPIYYWLPGDTVGDLSTRKFTTLKYEPWDTTSATDRTMTLTGNEQHSGANTAGWWYTGNSTNLGGTFTPNNTSKSLKQILGQLAGYQVIGFGVFGGGASTETASGVSAQVSQIVFGGHAYKFSVMSTDDTAKTVSLSGDYYTTSTIFVPDGYTFDGNGHTVFAEDPSGGAFSGAVIQNADGATSLDVKDVTIDGSHLGAAGPSSVTRATRLAGVRFLGASGSVKDSEITDIRRGAGTGGAQEGYGIDAYNAGGPTRLQITVEGDTVQGAQKGGVYLEGNVAGTIDGNPSIGAGYTGIASNGIAVLYGANAAISDNTIVGVKSSVSGYDSMGILSYGGNQVLVTDNTITGNADVGVDTTESDGFPLGSMNITGNDFSEGTGTSAAAISDNGVASTPVFYRNNTIPIDITTEHGYRYAYHVESGDSGDPLPGSFKQDVTATSIDSLVLSKSTQAYDATAVATATATVGAVNDTYVPGQVEFFSGDTELGSALTTKNSSTNEGTATFAFPSTLAAGSYPISAVFYPNSAADYDTSPSTSATGGSGDAGDTLDVTRAATDVSKLVLNKSSQTYDSTSVATITATVTKIAGSVAFYNVVEGGDDALLGQVSTSTGTAALKLPKTLSPAGIHSLYAVFSPTSVNYADSGASSAVSFTVAKASSSVSVVPARTYQGAGEDNAVTATVTSGVAGTVQFTLGSADIGDAITVADNQATLPLTGDLALTATSKIGAVFTPADDQPYAVSTATAKSITVDANSTSISSLVLGADSQDYDATPTSVTATVAPVDGKVVAGTVSFYANEVKLGSVAVGKTTGIAKYSFSKLLAVGSYDISAVFTPTTLSSYAISPTITSDGDLVVDSAPAPIVTVTGWNSAQTYGGTAKKLAITVSPAISGKASIIDGVGSDATVLGTATVTAGKASFSLSSTLPAGAHQLVVRFLPTDAGFTAPGDSTGLITVVPATPTVSAVTSSKTSQTYSSASVATVTATVSKLAGTVAFFAGGNKLGQGTVSTSTGKASLALASSLDPGAYTISAVFTPTSGNYQPVTGTKTVKVTVVKATATVAIALDKSTQLLNDEDSASATVTVPANLTGTVTLYDGTKTPSKLLATDSVSGDDPSTVVIPLPASLALGSHSIIAYFDPSDTTHYNLGVSKSSAATLTVTNSAVTVDLTDAGQTYLGTPTSVTATATPGGTAGSVQFYDGTAKLGTAVKATVASGTTTAHYTFSKSLVAGVHQISAVFTPSSTATKASGKADPAALTVAKATVVGGLTVTPISAVVVYGGTGKSIVVHVPSKLAGTVAIDNGSTRLASAAVSTKTGIATVAISKTLLPGVYDSLTAVFTPSVTSYATPESEDAGALYVTAAATSVTEALSKTSQTHGSSSVATVTVTVSVKTAGVATIYDGSIELGHVTVSSKLGKVSFAMPKTLAIGAHQITAQFAPTSSGYAESALSVAKTLTVK